MLFVWRCYCQEHILIPQTKNTLLILQDSFFFPPFFLISAAISFIMNYHLHKDVKKRRKRWRKQRENSARDIIRNADISPGPKQETVDDEYLDTLLIAFVFFLKYMLHRWARCCKPTSPATDWTVSLHAEKQPAGWQGEWLLSHMSHTWNGEWIAVPLRIKNLGLWGAFLDSY